MARFLSVDDLFTVGVSFDLLGGYLLGRSLLASPLDIARRTMTLLGSNPYDVASQMEARVDGEAGLVALLTGFLLQAAAYVAVLSGAEVRTGGTRAQIAVALSITAAAASWQVTVRMRRRRLRRLAVDVARAKTDTNSMDSHPDGETLVWLGRYLGYAFEGDMRDSRAVEDYAKRYFGVDRVRSDGIP